MTEADPIEPDAGETCPHCGADMPDDADRCPRCGRSADQPVTLTPPKPLWVKALAWAILLLAVAGVVLWAIKMIRG
ncbi:MAG: hypothetical protein BIFFINMI_01093 [Phycisphaerae bacterium]|nr:hypothetical protein [Phycisphaerae bacterium]